MCVCLLSTFVCLFSQILNPILFIGGVFKSFLFHLFRYFILWQFFCCVFMRIFCCIVFLFSRMILCFFHQKKNIIAHLFDLGILVFFFFLQNSTLNCSIFLFKVLEFFWLNLFKRNFWFHFFFVVGLFSFCLTMIMAIIFWLDFFWKQFDFWSLFFREFEFKYFSVYWKWKYISIEWDWFCCCFCW